MIVLRRPAISTPTFISSANVVVADTLGGTQDGSNFTYTTTFDYKPSRIHVSYNGQMLSSPDDFVESDTNEVQLRWIRPQVEDVIRATYETTSSGLDDSDYISVLQDIDLVYNTGLWESTASDFTSLPADLQVFFNGVKQRDDGGSYSVSIVGGKITVDFTFSTSTDDWVNVTYSTIELHTGGGTPGTGASLLSGKESITNYIQTISFGQTLSTSDYELIVSLFTTNVNPSIYSYVVTDKTTTGFTIEFSGDIHDTSDYTLDWMITNY